MTRARAALGLAAALLLGPALAGCASDADAAGGGTPELTAEGAYIPRPPTAELAGGFLTIENTGDADDALTSVTSEAADSVEIHTTEGGTMHQADALLVPAGGELRLAHGGSHLMIMGLDSRPAEGDTVPIQLHFEKSPAISLEVPVRPATYTGE
ncbi:copper chaperone PCu(A)C [Streptomyces hoynatensis]|uniref:Copper chaperone PCu(A)C n=1 Tax=Streptomyces hoynatensis TaxID=1141874 RepID=A0A3A9YPT7_9ACTN|nr:copper chaperone PCu(A)C [Streptomyces hoynatensis]RKN38015.1 copper chaperone PCu(A)C [Streptomyces hoynatensis]